MARSRPLLKNVLSKCTPKNVLSKCTLRTCYPSAPPRTCYPSAHSERAIQVHGILVYYSCTTNLVHLSYLCTSRASLIFVHPSRAPLLSCTQLVHYLVHHQYCVPNSCITHTRAPISCTSTLVHPSRAPPILCTTRAPLCTLVHPSCAPLILVYHSAILCTTM